MPTTHKLAWIDALFDDGLREIEVGSFVPARLLPQMADAAEVVRHALAKPAPTVMALVPNLRGAAAAILLSAFQNYGINPGPQWFETDASLVWALIASLCIGNLMLPVLNLPMVGLWVKLLKIPKAPLCAGMPIFATVGVYGMGQRAFVLYLMPGLGLACVVMRRFDLPTAPVIVGLILCPVAGAQMRNALSIGQGKWTVFHEQRPMSAALLVIVATVLLLPRLIAWRRRARASGGPARRGPAGARASVDSRSRLICRKFRAGRPAGPCMAEYLAGTASM